MRRRRHSFFICGAVLFLALASLGGACESDVLDDPTFHLWCGDRLCAWRLEAGSVRRAPTWHEADYGVELVDVPTVMSQTTDQSPRCIEFTMLADVDPSAQVTLGIDFNADDTVDVEQPIAASDWHRVQTLVTSPRAYSGIKFSLAKRGTGRAVLAELRGVSKSDCGAATPLELHDVPLGARCDTAAGGRECASGVCCGGACSECCAGQCPSADGDASADGGVAASLGCALVDSTVYQCNPHDGSRASGTACMHDDDCASGACEGAVTTRFLTNACSPEPLGDQLPKCPAGYHGGRCR